MEKMLLLIVFITSILITMIIFNKLLPSKNISNSNKAWFFVMIGILLCITAYLFYFKLINKTLGLILSGVILGLTLQKNLWKYRNESADNSEDSSTFKDKE